MARGRPVVIVQAACVLACSIAGSHAAFGQTLLGGSGSIGSLNLGPISTTPLTVGGGTITLPGIAVGSLVAVAPSTVSISRNEVSATLGSTSLASGLVKIGQTSVSAGGNGINATLPSIGAANGLVNIGQTSLSLNKNGLTADLPNLQVAGVSVDTAPIVVNTSGSGPLLQVGAPGLQSVINQATPVAQLVASTANAEAMAPVDQLINGMAFSDGTSGSSAPSSCAGLASAAFAPGAELSVSAWNSVSFGNSEHSYQVNSEVPGCSAALSFEGLQRTFLPGTVMDASKAFGMKPGTLHFGFSGGQSESDTRVKATDALRSAGFSDTGTTKLTSWSLGGYSLLTSNEWYAGTAVGVAWGQAETENFVLGSTSDYDTSGFVVASFVGKVVPLTETMRVDLRGTLSFQRTVGDAHVDTAGVSYSDHVIEAADASISARLFGVFRDGDNVLRPFVQAGVTHHLTYDNRLEIDSVAYQLHEADTSLFTAAGIDLEVGRAFQFSIGVRHDYSPDQENLTGRIGFTARFN